MTGMRRFLMTVNTKRKKQPEKDKEKPPPTTKPLVEPATINGSKLLMETARAFGRVLASIGNPLAIDLALAEAEREAHRILDESS